MKAAFLLKSSIKIIDYEKFRNWIDSSMRNGFFTSIGVLTNFDYYEPINENSVRISLKFYDPGNGMHTILIAEYDQDN